MRAWKILLVPGCLVGVSWGEPVRAECPVGKVNPETPLDMPALAAETKRASIAVETFAPELERGKPETVKFQEAIDLGDELYGVLWTQCLREQCRGYFALVDYDGSRVKLKRKSLLPFWYDAWKKQGVEIEVSAVHDIDSDGEMELLVQYKITEPPRPGAGSRWFRLLGVWNFEHPDLQWVYEIDKGGEHDHDEHCDGKVIRQDFNCDGLTDVLVERVCRPEFCLKSGADDPACRQDSRRKGFRFRKETGHYLGFGDDETIVPVNDDSPWLVIAGSFAVSSADYDLRAQEVAGKLVAGGFKGATVYNSRVFRSLSCCYREVVAGRFKAKADAQKQLAELKAKGFKAYVRKGF
jgi:hypothetical protein